MASGIAKAANRDDVYELVRLAHAYPEDAAEIDEALQQVAIRLGSKRKIHELAHILTLPAGPKPWTAVETAVRELISVGPNVKQAVRSVGLSATDSTKLRAIKVLEGTGNEEAAAELRCTYRSAG